MTTPKRIYAFDCGTTNWRICRLNCQESLEKGNNQRLQPISEPQIVALTTFNHNGQCLPASILLDKDGQIQRYGQNAYELACEPTQLAYLRDAFKLCIGNHQSPSPLDPCCRYTHREALNYTQLLLSQVVEQLEREKPSSLDKRNLFYFAHPVHWGREQSDGSIEGSILTEFAREVRTAFPLEVHNNIHFVPEPGGALVSLMQSGQLREKESKQILVVDAGGGTTDLVAGRWTAEGLQDVKYYGGLNGGGLFDQDLAEYLAQVLNISQEQRQAAWPELRRYGQRLKESLSQQVQVDATVPVTMKVMLELLGENGDSVFLSQSLNFTCQEFEKWTERTRHELKELILQAILEMELRKSDIAQVVLVGGGAKLYLVPRILKEIFGKSVPVIYGDPPEHTIVRGVALWPVRPKVETTMVLMGESKDAYRNLKLRKQEVQRKSSKSPSHPSNVPRDIFNFDNSSEEQNPRRKTSTDIFDF